MTGSRKEPPSPPAYGVGVEEVRIPMADGVRLAANLFLPDGGATHERFPPLLEYLPYHKDDGTIARDYAIHGYFARRGYIGARVDIRGTGRSEGQAPDREYSDQEHSDGLEVIAWLARQPWSNGKVGMFGLSWGGFNSIQIAALHPPALRAIIAVHATEDLFQDDIHFIDGLMHIDQYELEMDQFTPQTPAPDFPVDEASLAERFDVPPWKLLWMRHQRDGPFWRRASLVGRYEALRVPVFLIGGWLDGYRDSIPRILERVRAPVKAIVGPWNHAWPHAAVPGPSIEWRAEAVRWWDYWLKGRDTGILDEPRLAVFVRKWHPPDPALSEIPGEWRFEDGWPIRRIQGRILFLREDHSLSRTPGFAAVHDLVYVPSVGAEAGFWWGDLVPDQAPLDRRCLVYDSKPLREPLEIFGLPQVLLHGSASASLAHWFVRLSDVAPQGSVTLITGAGLNGAHRTSATDPEPLEPGRVYPFEIECHFTSWVFPRGHRIRVAVSNALWPMIWPTPQPMTTRLLLGASHPSRILLPVVPQDRRTRPRFLPPELSDPAPGVRSRGSVWPGKWTARRDPARRSAKVRWRGSGTTEFPWGREDFHEWFRYSVEDDHPERASMKGLAETVVRHGKSVLTWRARLELTSDVEVFRYVLTRELQCGNRVLRRRTWRESIPRDFQ